MSKEIMVGNEYTRPLGATKQFVTIVGINDDGTVNVVSKSGKQRFKTKIENVDRWELVKAVEVREAPERIANTAPKKVEVKADGTVAVVARKRLNERPFVEVLIDTINASNVPMTARELVDKVKADGTFKFKETAKTPWNSASSRLHTYLSNHTDANFKVVGRGKFARKDYEAEA